MIKNDLIHILDNVIDKNKFSNIELNYYFELKGYSLAEKAFIKNLFSVTIKNLIYIDYIIDNFTKKVSKRRTRQILRLSIAQMYFTNADIKGVVYEANELAKQINVEQGKFVNAVLKNIIRNKDKLDKKIEENKWFNIKYSYPTYIYNKFLNEYKDKAIDIMKALKERSYLSVRVNTRKISVEKFLEKIKTVDTKILFRVENVFYLDNYKIFEKRIFKNNEITIQDASSYIVSKNMDIKTGDRVLDACSAPGGKSLAMLDLYNPEVLFSCDIYDHKIDKLEELKEKYKYSNMNVLKKDASRSGQFLEEYFDKILLDVPCSGLGVLRKKPEKVYTLTSNDIKALKKIQKNIFQNNLAYLKKGGYLIYSTCTLTREENTNNIKYFLENNKNLEVVDLDLPCNIEYEKDEYNGVYISPLNKYLDGFYIIKFKKV